MNKGDIVLVPFPFTNLEGAKKRSAVVLYGNEIDIIAVFVTTNLKWVDEKDVLIEPNESNRLKKSSLIRISKIATLDKSIVIGKIGVLDKETINSLDVKLKLLFEIS
jgi:mRNA interferase MazF